MAWRIPANGQRGRTMLSLEGGNVMAYAMALDLGEFRQLSRPRTTDPLKLARAARSAAELANAVEHRWDEMPEEVRQRLVCLAYAIIEPPRTLRRFVGTMLGRFYLSWLVMHGEIEVLNEYLSAVVRLVNAILARVEAEQEPYRETLAAAIEAAKTRDRRAMSPGEFGDWLTDVSRRSDREIRA